jgi:hypothetical protein
MQNLSENAKRKLYQLEDLGMGVKTILKELDMSVWTGFIWLRIGSIVAL